MPKPLPLAHIKVLDGYTSAEIEALRTAGAI